MTDFRKLLNTNPRPIITNLPAPDIFGTVFVMNHGRFFSVNHVSDNGTGWQSDRILERDEAELAAEVLALHCRAELV